MKHLLSTPPGWLCGIALWAASGPALLAAAEPVPDVLPIRATLIDPDAIAYATFQSHNQKVVSNRNGVFLTYLRSANADYTAQEWCLARSSDGGRSFAVIHRATDATNPPVLETDARDNLYLVRPDFKDGHAYLYRFPAASGYGEPAVSRIPGGSAGKYSLALDARREQLYYFAHNGTFHVVGPDGKVRSSCRLLKEGPNAALQYPLLALAADGTLYAAWTTSKYGVYLYWDIHAMRSADGGTTWQKLDGTPLALPVVADDRGPADRVSRDDEFAVHSWLSACLAAHGKLHLVYWAETNPQRQRYVRYDGATGKAELDVQPLFRDRKLKRVSDSGVLVTRAGLARPPLYILTANDDRTRLACLASDDDGATWYEYAVGDRRFDHRAYSIGGARELTADGSVIGTFTDVTAGAKSYTEAKSGKVYYFKFQAGLARAVPAAVKFAGGELRLAFDQVRGQPREIRFRGAGDVWGGWLTFRKEMTVKTTERPRQYQLRSRLGVVAPACSLTE